MSFKQLYELVQLAPRNNGARISTRWVREKAVELSPIKKFVEKWSSIIDDQSIRGFYIEGPLGPPIPIEANQALITISRKVSADRAWRRLVLTKELMHSFDEEDEKTDTPSKLEDLTHKFANPNARDTRQFGAEVKALYRALSVLCREDDRKEFADLLKSGQISLEVVSAKLTLPVAYLHLMFAESFYQIVQSILE